MWPPRVETSPTPTLRSEMHIIIDGYNFIFGMYGLQHAEIQKVREKFLLRLQNYTEKKKVDLEVVFDAREKEYPLTTSLGKGLKIVFCPDADDYIRNTVRDNHNPASILVISSDKEITRDVRKKGAKIKSPSEFDMLLNKNATRKRTLVIEDNEKPSPENISKEEISDWLDEFARRKN